MVEICGYCAKLDIKVRLSVKFGTTYRIYDLLAILLHYHGGLVSYRLLEGIRHSRKS